MRKGFSLIEMLVVSSLLVIISTGAIASFSSVIKAQKYSLRTQYLLDQGDYAIDYMGKALRMARKETGEINCLNYGRNYEYHLQGIRFISFDDTLKCRAFYLEDGIIVDYQVGRTPEEIALTSSSTEVTNFSLIIDDFEGTQPFVKISFKIKSVDSDSPEIELKTAISQRELNLPLE